MFINDIYGKPEVIKAINCQLINREILTNPINPSLWNNLSTILFTPSDPYPIRR